MGQILVKSPMTSNGRDPIMGPDGKVRYKETILEEGAGKILEKINLKLPTHLKKIIEPYSPVKTVKAEKPVKEEKEEVQEVYDEPKTDKPQIKKRGPKSKS